MSSNLSVPTSVINTRSSLWEIIQHHMTPPTAGMPICVIALAGRMLRDRALGHIAQESDGVVISTAPESWDSELL